MSSCDKVCQWLSTGRWFSSTNKTDHHDIIEILLKVTCTICSAGDDCSNPAVAPTQCAAGTYSNQGDSGCTICPAGKSIP
jgi:hypothetical protein